MQHLHADNFPTRKQSEPVAYYRIASHYGYIMQQMFDCWQYPKVILLEVCLPSVCALHMAWEGPVTTLKYTHVSCQQMFVMSRHTHIRMECHSIQHSNCLSFKNCRIVPPTYICYNSMAATCTLRTADSKSTLILHDCEPP